MMLVDMMTDDCIISVPNVHFIEKRECRKLDVQPSICFSFKIEDADADGYDVNTATLWLFKSRRRQRRRQKVAQKYNQRFHTKAKETIIVSEVEQPLNRNFLPVVKTIAIQTVNVEGKAIRRKCKLF